MRIDREPALAELAVVDDVDTEVHLETHDVAHRGQELVLVLGRVHGFALVLRQHQLDELAGARQAAGVGDKNAVGAVSHGFLPLDGFLNNTCVGGFETRPYILVPATGEFKSYARLTGLNLYRVRSSVTSSNTTSTGMSQLSSSGLQPTTLVVRRGPSSNSTTTRA